MIGISALIKEAPRSSLSPSISSHGETLRSWQSAAQKRAFIGTLQCGPPNLEFPTSRLQDINVCCLSVKQNKTLVFSECFLCGMHCTVLPTGYLI